MSKVFFLREMSKVNSSQTVDTYIQFDLIIPHLKPMIRQKFFVCHFINELQFVTNLVVPFNNIYVQAVH